MIDSNNISVMRENIRKLNELIDPETISGLITNVDANTDAISDINSLIGATPLPSGQTITSALAFVSYGNLYGIDLRETDNGILSIKIFTTTDKVDTDRLEIQINTTSNKVRYLKYVAGEKTYDKSTTLS